ncbi:MAG: cell division protein ZapA [Ignavibacteria bacterium CG_4_8_14_3_um_filter_37_9]|jgi:cell division protein ZapA|nr:cell division protein ZapA [Ignavibacteria bacterium]OIO17892.1 MAG: cell division protein ZapA [Ignavibacteria bacterium CG1_02_37_35]PIP78582.1 MAG: cell division protein ZapA [Ignavibacteria bacterium CG22_combo_CG10-13_8_21_14_all_37_15]PIS45427.1 MAG: cell division protein ZapA [Ignavibacteria bacterium CG08_land_8_20_14_0_20_37_9]PIW99292.1 MAG: cell division protein ZapA [Ignavibacteria bacterium CG_4_8_14_3_um_filter_37_9]PIX94325.1 MAG: cell division protein ZapA [Ignavibacteria ba
MTEKKKLKVKIFDKEYSLLVDNEEIAKELAVYVNNVMEETKQELPDQPAQTIAIIASLNIAYDYFIEKNKNKEFLIQATDKVKKIKLLLNQSSDPIPS